MPGAGGGSTPDDGGPPKEVMQYRIGGTAIGILSSGLVLQNNGASDLAVDTDGSFYFAARQTSGSSYAVTVKKNPPGQTCRVTEHGSGAVGVQDVTQVVVSCTKTPIVDGGEPGTPSRYTVGGTISGLTGSGLVLASGSDQIAIPAGSTSFVFPTPLLSGASYVVGVKRNPSSQICVFDRNEGIIRSENVTTLTLVCTEEVPSHPQGNVTIDQDRLFFEAEEGQTVASQTITGWVTGNSEPVVITIETTNVGLIGASFKALSPTSGQLLVTPRRSTQLTPGTYRDKITLNACYDTACRRHVPGSPKSVNVTYVIAPSNPAPVLLLGDHGTALASTPSGRYLSRSLSVRDSTGTASTWTAVSDKSWLTVTPSGASGNALTLTANPAGLADGFYDARVVVTSSNTAIANAETVRVGFYVSHVESAANFADKPTVKNFQTGGFPAVVTWLVDPIRPLSYSTDGDAVTVHHSYSGRSVSSISLAPAALGGMAISDDGSRLYIQDTTNRRIKVVDLDTQHEVFNYPLPLFLQEGTTPFANLRMQYARVRGVPVLIFNYVPLAFNEGKMYVASVIKAETGALLGILDYLSSSGDLYAVVRDGSALYAAEWGVSGTNRVRRIELRANSKGNIFGLQTGEIGSQSESSLQDIATNSDGSKVFVRFYTRPFVDVLRYDGVALSVLGKLDFTFPDNQITHNRVGNIEVGPDDKLITHMQSTDLRLYDADLRLLRQWTDLPTEDSITFAGERQLQLTSDGLRVMGTELSDTRGYLLDLYP